MPKKKPAKSQQGYLPTEFEECLALVDYLNVHRLKFTHIHNEMYTKSWKQKVKAQQFGVSAGVPDYLIIIPKEKCNLGKAIMVFIEMKRTKNYKISQVQKDWIAAVNQIQNVGGFICKGYDEAKELLDLYL